MVDRGALPHLPCITGAPFRPGLNCFLTQQSLLGSAASLLVPRDYLISIRLDPSGQHLCSETHENPSQAALAAAALMGTDSRELSLLLSINLLGSAHSSQSLCLTLRGRETKNSAEGLQHRSRAPTFRGEGHRAQ